MRPRVLEHDLDAAARKTAVRSRGGCAPPADRRAPLQCSGRRTAALADRECRPAPRSPAVRRRTVPGSPLGGPCNSPGRSPAAAAASVSAFFNASLCRDWHPAAPQTLTQASRSALCLALARGRSPSFLQRACSIASFETLRCSRSSASRGPARRHPPPPRAPGRKFRSSALSERSARRPAWSLRASCPRRRRWT